MASMYCSGRAAVVICYDITDSFSFIKAKDWLLQFRIHSCNIYMCATKKDLCNENKAPNPSLDSVQEYAESVKTKFFATSSYTGENICRNEYFKIYYCKMYICIFIRVSSLQLSCSTQL